MIKHRVSKPHVIFLIERGWRGSRELAMMLTRQHIVCHLVIKGKVPQDVLEIISPRTGISVTSMSRWYFKIMILVKIVWLRLNGVLRCVVVNKERTLRWISVVTRLLGCETVLLNEKGEAVELADYQQRLLTPEQLVRIITSEDRAFL